MKFEFIRDEKYIKGAKMDLSVSEALLIFAALRDLSKNEERNELDRKSAMKMWKIFREEIERIE